MKIPLETVMKMPIQDRRYFIQKFNEEQEGIARARNKDSGQGTVEGEAINSFARLEQENMRNMKRG